MRGTKRKPWQAGLLSFFMPGLGQVYNGQAQRGLLFVCLYMLVEFACVVIMLELSLAPWNIAFPAGILLAGYLAILIDAVKTAHRQGETLQRKFYNRWYIYIVLFILYAFVIQPIYVLTLRHVWLQAFTIPSGAMESTLLVGDRLLVNKLRYRLTSPQRSDVVVFRYPWEEGRVFIKRVIALPGERVQIRDRQVYVNDQPLSEPYVRSTLIHRQDNFGPVVVPKKGSMIEIHSDQRLYLNGEPVAIPSNSLSPSGLFQPRNADTSMTGLEVFYAPLLPPGTTLQQAVGPFPVAHDYYFTLGDNRDNSQDSRHWGFVPRVNILGPAQRLYWSWDRETARVRWERLGQSIR
jgi:signal peptidase I